jgi:hypothetical protein
MASVDFQCLDAVGGLMDFVASAAEQDSQHAS